MKKIIAILSSAILLSTFVGCGLFQKSETYVYEEDGYYAEIKIYHKGDEVTKYEMESKIILDDDYLEEEEAEDFIEYYEEYYGDLNGVEVDVKVKKDTLTLKIEVDWKKVDLDQLEDSYMSFPGMPYDYDYESAPSLEGMEENLLDNDFEKK